MLAAREVHASYGRAPVLHGVSVRVDPGEIVALLGPNGAGKTTTLRVLSGFLHPSAGTVVFDGKPVAGRGPEQRVRAGLQLVPEYRWGMPPETMARLGIGHVPENRGVFRNLTVSENLRLGGYLLRRQRARYRDQFQIVLDTFPILAQRLTQQAGTLSGGEQQMLAIGRAMMGAPRLLLIDEASLGLAPVVVQHLYDVLRRLNEAGTALLVVEQSPGFALRIAHRAYVMQKGTIVFEGRGGSVKDQDLLRAYLG